ncbi:hypothetical protein FA95DRAFT_1578087 [Auriscalpium vulgare]|uniref:Uncharacterized protein n=1 Tax=Auriscalpium vulgare TaxID=40419 RepID=A0ACB8R3Y9_9AGAM|nr:hypothetical protein FA95DRAFT_1578087 [Auriscalpium vulgare]
MTLAEVEDYGQWARKFLASWVVDRKPRAPNAMLETLELLNGPMPMVIDTLPASDMTNENASTVQTAATTPENIQPLTTNVTRRTTTQARLLRHLSQQQRCRARLDGASSQQWQHRQIGEHSGCVTTQRAWISLPPWVLAGGEGVRGAYGHVTSRGRGILDGELYSCG